VGQVYVGGADRRLEERCCVDKGSDIVLCWDYRSDRRMDMCGRNLRDTYKEEENRKAIAS